MKNETLVLEVNAEPDFVLRRVTEQLLKQKYEGARGGPFSVVYQDRRRITVSRWTLNLGLLLFLLFLGFVPGIVYAFAVRSKVRLTTVEVGRGEGGTRVMISGNDPRASKTIARFLERGFR